MGVESVTGIWDLNELWPLSSDDRTTADDHFRLIKSSLLNTFPNISGTVGVTDTEINHLSGISRNIETAIDALSASVQANEAAIDAVSAVAASNASAIESLSVDLDTLSQNVGGQYHGLVNGAAGTSFPWPSGWTVTASATGAYVVTHGLGVGLLSAAIQLSPYGAAIAGIVASSANGFKVYTYALTTQSRVDAAFYYSFFVV